ncbi:tetratricopeptide repeat-containing glycosyltransferase [Lacrimispora indolis]|uniref:tetratricopeptide repeat-containing glycosyltransferase n=1 Tax=Lacrimispora indolis TaxID=69825 RepID=UPI000424B77B|nr:MULTISPECIES: glycosyltransferase [Lachnospiraceae]MBE7722253.1 glycosyltransferase [Lacrimispora celerecrescens]
MKLKICVYAICKNEVQFVDKWMDSMSEADLIVVTDTGSEDGTVEKLRERGAVVYVDIVKPWRFDVARNISLDHVPEDADICVCTDLDELFEPGWRNKLEEAWLNHKPKNPMPAAKWGRYLYNWSLKEDGTPDIQFYYFKVHSRMGFRWKCPVHEFLQYTEKLPVETIYIEGMVLSHYPDPDKSRGSYLPLLELAVEEAPEDERMRYYLGREYMYKSQWKKCIETLKEYLAMPSAVWSDERCAAMRWIAKSCYKTGYLKEAYAWYYKAIAEVPDIRDHYVEFSKMCYELKDWSMTYFLTKEALKIKEKSKTFVNMGYSWDYTPDDYCSIAAFWLGMTKESLEHAKSALQYDPHNERLKNNYNIIAAKWNLNN